MGRRRNGGVDTAASVGRSARGDSVARRDSAARRASATYTVTIPDSLRDAWGVGARSAFVLTLVPTRDVPGARKTGRDSTRRDSAATRDSSARAARSGAHPVARVARGSLRVAGLLVPSALKPKRRPAPADTTPLDLTVELVDANGVAAAVPLSRYGPLRRPLEIRTARRAKRDVESYRTTYELVPQSFVLPVADFAAAAPAGFDAGRVRAVRLRFDRTRKGTVILTALGVTSATP